jgi:hypothetical protein
MTTENPFRADFTEKTEPEAGLSGIKILICALAIGALWALGIHLIDRAHDKQVPLPSVTVPIEMVVGK